MSRDVCGICWCPYDDDGECGCKPTQVLDQYSLAKIKDDEALLRQALHALRLIDDAMPFPVAKQTIAALRERLGVGKVVGKREHITDGSPCWCNPETTYTDPDTGASVIVHKEPQ